jgi:murein hydrolase activator
LANLIAKIAKSAIGRTGRVRHIVAGALLFASMAAAQSIDEERQALVRAKAQAAAADQRAAAFENKAAAEISEAEAAKAQAAAVASRIQSAESEILAAEARIKLIEGLRSEQRARLRAKQEPAVRLVAALQMMSRRPPALALVQPGSLTDIVHVRAVLASILPVVKQRTAGLRAELEAGRRLRLDAGQALAALATSRTRLLTERAALVRLAAEHRRASDAFSGNALVEQDRAVALGERARDIVDLMAEINAGAETRERLAALSGPLLRPVSPGDPRADPIDRVETVQRGLPYRIPVVGSVIAGLGEVSDAGVRSRGLTFSTRAQAQVIAPAAGRIAFAGPYRGFGQIIIIDHGRRWTTLITSLATLDVRVGDNVVQGSPVGRAARERPTITVELRRGTVPIDITPFVAG